MLNYYRVEDEAQPIDWGTGADLLAVWGALDQCGVGSVWRGGSVCVWLSYRAFIVITLANIVVLCVRSSSS